MKFRSPLSWLWVVFLLAACSLFVWTTTARIDHLEFLSKIGVDDDVRTAIEAFPDHGGTGLTPGNALPIPDRSEASYHWIGQTERMLNRGELRVRHIDDENAPFGRAVLTPSPYRWWLGFLAWCSHCSTGAASATQVERAALWADPILLVLLAVLAAILAAKAFGSLSASLVSIAFVSFFPFVTGYRPGVPDDRGLALGLAIASVLLVAAALVAPPPEKGASRRGLLVAGVIGGVGLWVNVSVGLMALGGIGLGSLLVARVRRGRATDVQLPPVNWRVWAGAGAATTCLASLLDYSPAELGTGDLAFIHPLYALAWLGAGELMQQASAWLERRTFSRSPKNLVWVGLAFAAVAVVPAAFLRQQGLAGLSLAALSVSTGALHEGPIFDNFTAGIALGGRSIGWVLVLAPLGLLVPAVWVLASGQAARPTRSAVAISLGPVGLALIVAGLKLGQWQTVDALLLVTLAAVVPVIAFDRNATKLRPAWMGAIVALLVPGLAYSVFGDKPRRADPLSPPELRALILRDLARWISQHAEPGALNVLSPPSASTALCYYGAFRGLGSFSPENKEGIQAVIRIMSGRSVAEVKEVISRRQITHLVLVSWDTFFADCATAATGQIEGTFRDQLKFTTLPVWLRPLAYRLPLVAGFEDQSVTVLQVVEDRDEATTISDLALYFAEMGQTEQARRAAEGLARFPIDFGAWVARAQVAAVTGDSVELAKDLKTIQARLGARVQPLLSWNRRVDLAVVLARARREPEARKQLERCVAEADGAKIRSLSPESVFRLLVLCRGFGVELAPEQRALALSLVPSVLRARLP